MCLIEPQHFVEMHLGYHLGDPISLLWPPKKCQFDCDLAKDFVPIWNASAMLPKSNPATGTAGGSNPIDKVSWTRPDNKAQLVTFHVEHQAEAGDGVGNFKPKSFCAAATVGGALESGGARSPSPRWNKEQMNRDFGGDPDKDDDKEMEGNGGAVGDHNDGGGDGGDDGKGNDNSDDLTGNNFISACKCQCVATQAAPIYRKRPRLSAGQQALRDIASSAAEFNKIFGALNARS
ncbi:hypothetical protein B0H11DRAFT_2207097 [Mycena galericulata]|nr:hypothetical protein B0H11DRAFT_2207097 [Mycena galericulata]